jgi:very-short-patch-repair endonuclease
MGVSNIEWWERMQYFADEADIADGIDWDKSSFEHVKISSEAWRIESPLEYRLYAWLKRLGAKYGYLIKAQWQLDRFRYDFAVLDKCGEKLLALIECDSAEFHHSPQQLKRDKEKDEAAKAAGIRLFRWSGKEIYRDAHQCAEATFFSIWPAGQ